MTITFISWTCSPDCIGHNLKPSRLKQYLDDLSCEGPGLDHPDNSTIVGPPGCERKLRPFVPDPQLKWVLYRPVHIHRVEGIPSWRSCMKVGYFGSVLRVLDLGPSLNT